MAYSIKVDLALSFPWISLFVQSISILQCIRMPQFKQISVQSSNWCRHLHIELPKTNSKGEPGVAKPSAATWLDIQIEHGWFQVHAPSQRRENIFCAAIKNSHDNLKHIVWNTQINKQTKDYSLHIIIGWYKIKPWWRHQMETFSASLALCTGIPRSTVNSPHKVQRRGALVFSLICALNKRLSKQPWGWWFEKPSPSLWRHCNAKITWSVCCVLPRPGKDREITPKQCTNYHWKLFFHTLEYHFQSRSFCKGRCTNYERLWNKIVHQFTRLSLIIKVHFHDLINSHPYIIFFINNSIWRSLDVSIIHHKLDKTPLWPVALSRVNLPSLNGSSLCKVTYWQGMWPVARYVMVCILSGLNYELDVAFYQVPLPGVNTIIARTNFKMN